MSRDPFSTGAPPPPVTARLSTARGRRPGVARPGAVAAPRVARRAGGRRLRLPAAALAVLGVLAAWSGPPQAFAACGAIPAGYPTQAGRKLDIKGGVIMNGNPVPKGKTGADSVIDSDGTRGTVSETLPDLDPVSFPANGSNVDADEGDSPFHHTTEVFYDEIEIGKNESAVFSGGGPFHIDELDVKKGATLYLGPGIYYVDHLKLADDATIVITGEPVQLHIGDKLDAKDDVTINAGGSVTGLQVYLHDGAEFKSDKRLDFTGLIYGPRSKKVEIKEDSSVRGAIVTGGEVKIEEDTTLTYTAADEAAVASLTTCPGSLHFAVVHDGTAVNCQAEAVVIEAHRGDHGLDTDYTGTVTLSTSSGNGAWSLVAGTGVLTGSGGGAASYRFAPADGGRVVLGLYDPVVESVDIGVIDGAAVEDPAEDPPLAFAESGFTFLADGAANAIATQIAGKPSSVPPAAQALALRAVNTNTDTGACEAALVGTVDVELAFECLDPATCGGASVWVSGTPVAGNPAGAVSGYTPVPLDFGTDVDDAADLDLLYPDSGRIRLHARYALPPAAGGIYMTGASNAFVVRPFGFDIDFSGDRQANGTSGPSYAADATGSRFVKAGEPFQATVTAVQWQAADDLDGDGAPDPGATTTDNAVAASFGREVPAPVVVLSRAMSSPTAAEGAVLGAFTGGLVLDGFGTAAGGGPGSDDTDVAYHEVGIIDIAASLADYLGSGAAVSGAAGNVGVFVPARLSLGLAAPLGFADGPDAAWTASCSFTYMDQAFRFEADPRLVLTAHKLDGSVAMNFGKEFWTVPAGPLATRSYVSNTAAAILDAPLDGTVTLNGHDDFDGVATYTLSDETFSYMRAAAPVAGFAADVAMRVPADGFVDPGPGNGNKACVHPSAAECDVTQGDVGMDFEVTSVTGASMVFGRLAMRNSAGSELLDLAVPVQAQIYSGNGFSAHTADVCTRLGGSTYIDLANALEDPAPGVSTIAIAGSTTTASIASDPLAAGDAGLSFSAPGADQTGYTELSFDLSIPTGAAVPWLQFDWDGDGAHDDDPSARATFGIYAGSEIVIYFREPWN